jgi:hypothetical protein
MLQNDSQNSLNFSFKIVPFPQIPEYTYRVSLWQVCPDLIDTPTLIILLRISLLAFRVTLPTKNEDNPSPAELLGCCMILNLKETCFL